MQKDPGDEWRRLTALYGEMGDLEIHDLANQINDLTETAQQVPRDEMKKRGINQADPVSSLAPSARGAQIHNEPRYYRDQFADAAPDEDGPHEYSWKVSLCGCDTREQTLALAEALKNSGIDSWIKAPASRFDTGNYEILVAADQLDDARAIAAQPIPQQVLDRIKADEAAPEYEAPICPRCRTADPALESVEPSNNWLCESCGFTWSDPVDDSVAGAGSTT